MLSSFINALNDNQRAAVKQPLVPLLVLAGPGTGKTRILIARIAWLIHHYSIPPERILALTFTNKAAEEMRSRLVSLCGQEGTDVKAGTIHSFALEILRRYHHIIGMEKNFSVCDQEYQHRLLRNLCAPVIRDNLENKVKGILLSFSQKHMRGKKLPPFAREKYIEYQNHLKKHQLMDFDQIIINCKILFKQNPDILSEYQYLYPAILVDEFQDTDPIQYEIIKLLASKEKNIFIVADDDQSIYSWRGANPENIRSYIKDFKVEKIRFLDTNYRSGEKIIDSAQSIILNTDRVEPDKKLKSVAKLSDSIKVYLFNNEQNEINFLLEKIKYWRHAGVPFSEIAVIFPFHRIGQSLEHYFIKEKIPYQMAAGNSFLENPVLQQIILFLKIIRDLNDDIALEQLSETALGFSLTKRIKQRSFQRNISFRKSLYDFYKMKKGELEFESILKIKNFVSQIANLSNLKTFFSLSRLIDEIYGMANQNKISYLSKKSKLLETPPDLNEFGIHINDINSKKLIYVYHPNKIISYLAIQLISKVFNKPVKLWRAEHNNEDLSDAVLFALTEPMLKNYNISIVPVFKIVSSKRQGTISNLFKILQGLSGNEDKKLYNNCIILDLETTDNIVENCGIVEIAAIRINKGRIVDEIQNFINPQKPISKGAQAVHHITEKDIQNAPTIEEFWPEFKKFIGTNLLVAHNGYNFDFTILDRFAKRIDGKRLTNLKLDSLVMAQSLFPNQSNSIDALIDRFKLNTETRHRALDDVKVLHSIIQVMQDKRKELFQKSALEIYTDIVALANHFEKKYSATEDRIFYLNGCRKLISPYSRVFDQFCDKFDQNKSELITEIKKNITNIDSDYTNFKSNENFILKIKLLANEHDKLPIDEAIANFLSVVNLNSGGQEQLENINAVSLLTFHAVKGLEFEKVILMGLEKNNLPGYHSLRDDPDDDRPIIKKIEEQRRLLYVGITRGKNEVLLTAVKNRGGWENESSPFIKDLNVPKVIVNN